MSKLTPNYEAGLQEELAGLKARSGAIPKGDERQERLARQIKEVEAQLKGGRPSLPAKEERPQEPPKETR